MRRLLLTLFSLFVALSPLAAQDDEPPLAYLVHDESSQVDFIAVWADNRHDSRYAGYLPGEFGFRQSVSWESVGVVRFGVDFAIGDYALSPDRTRLAFSAYDPANVTASDGNVYRGHDYGLFIYDFAQSAPGKPVIARIDIDHPVDVIWSPEGDALLLPAVGIEGFPTPFYPGEPDTLIYDLTAETFYSVQAGDPEVFYVDGYDGDLNTEGKTYYYSATPPYAWLPDGRILFQSGGIDCANQCRTWRDLYVADRDGSNVERLAMQTQQMPDSGRRSFQAAVWSPVDERVYVEIDSDDTNNRRWLFSVDLNGRFRPEIMQTGGDFLPVQPVGSQGRVYVTGYTAGAGWSIRQVGGSAPIIYQNEAGVPNPTVDAISPDGRSMAVNYGTVTRVVDLESGVITATLETGAVCGLRWLDDSHFVYQTVRDPFFSALTCPDETDGIWTADVEERDLIDLTERWNTPLRLLVP